jgi:hemerythrin
MTYFPWSDEFSVGIRVIDNDHKDLFRMVNALYAELEGGSSAKNIDALLTALGRYVEEHFAREEELMKTYNYPGLAAHKAKHRELTLDVYALRKAHVSHPYKMDGEKLLMFLKNWLSNHIMRSDMDYVPYFRDQDAKADKRVLKGKASPAEQAPSCSEMVDVSVNVPKESVAAVERCAKLLRGGGVLAAELEVLVLSPESMTEEEAEQRVGALLAV